MKFSYGAGYIVTANEEGHAHLNSRIVCKPDEVHGPSLQMLIEQANGAAFLQAILEDIERDTRDGSPLNLADVNETARAALISINGPDTIP